MVAAAHEHFIVQKRTHNIEPRDDNINVLQTLVYSIITSEGQAGKQGLLHSAWNILKCQL